MLALSDNSRAHAYGRQQLPSRRPVQRIVRVVRRRGHQDDVLIALVEVARVQDMLQVDQGDGAWDGGFVDFGSHDDQDSTIAEESASDSHWPCIGILADNFIYTP